MVSSEFLAILLLSSMQEESTGAVCDCKLTYDPDTNPFAVTMHFTTPGDPDGVSWHFDRELLRKAVREPSDRPVGEGDIRMRADAENSRLIVCLKNPEGHADVGFPLDVVTRFVTEVEWSVPSPSAPVTVAGAAVDKLIEEILG